MFEQQTSSWQLLLESSKVQAYAVGSVERRGADASGEADGDDSHVIC
jgi:hypothetical protein